MKGPGLRIDLDVRRAWRCAKCGRVVRTPAHVVSQRCSCPETPWMALQLPVKREPFRPPVREPLPETEIAPDQPAVPPVADISVTGITVNEIPVAELPAAESPVDASQSEILLTASTTVTSPAPPATAAIESAVGKPAALGGSPANPPSDDFGAGLDDAAPEPPA